MPIRTGTPSHFPLSSVLTVESASSVQIPSSRDTGNSKVVPLAWLVVPAQPVDATPSSASIQQCFRGRTICLAVLRQNLARTAFRLVLP